MNRPADIQNTAVTQALDRAAAFWFVRNLFRTPSPEQWSWLTAAETGRFWGALVQALEDPIAMPLPHDAATYEQQFIEAFEAGAPHAPVPLIESHYNKRDPVPKILHENILYYQTFGLRLRSCANETADHLRHQLEFTGWLWQLEAAELRAGAEPDRLQQIRQARSDYTRRHQLSWLPAATQKAADAPYPWVRSWMQVVLSLVGSDP